MNSYFIDFTSYTSPSERYLAVVAVICCASRFGYDVPELKSISTSKNYTGCYVCAKYGLFLIENKEQVDSFYINISPADFCQLTEAQVYEEE